MKKMLRKQLTKEHVARLKGIKNSVQLFTLKLFSQTQFLTDLYYAFLNREFATEKKAVLTGRYAYYKNQSASGASSVLLRRNTHRLEKGLIMRPRKAVFAAGYIEETVHCYAQCLFAKQVNAAEIKWADDVLSQYFSVVEHNKSPAVAQAYALFAGLDKPLFSDGAKSSPYCHRQLPECAVSNEQLQQLFLRRRSVRWFQDKPVPQALLTKAVNQASLAPSACNRQPFQFHTLLQPQAAQEAAALAMGTAGFADNIPCLIAVVGDLSAYPFERDRHVIYIDGALAAMQLMLSLETLGLSSCPINWPEIPARDKKMAARLNLQEYEKVVMLIALGYADAQGMIPFSQKKPAELLLKIVN